MANDTLEARGSKGQPNGYASLDANGHLPAVQNPGSTSVKLLPGTVTGAVLGNDVLTTGGPQSKLGPLLLFGGFGVGQSPNAPLVGSGSTIQTAGFGVSRVTTSAPASNVTLSVGTTSNPWLVVLNESAGSITFGPASSSHVANGAACVIAGLTCRLFVWSSPSGLWFPIGLFSAVAPTGTWTLGDPVLSILGVTTILGIATTGRLTNPGNLTYTASGLINPGSLTYTAIAGTTVWTLGDPTYSILGSTTILGAATSGRLTNPGNLTYNATVGLVVPAPAISSTLSVPGGARVTTTAAGPLTNPSSLTYTANAVSWTLGDATWSVLGSTTILASSGGGSGLFDSTVYDTATYS